MADDFLTNGVTLAELIGALGISMSISEYDLRRMFLRDHLVRQNWAGVPCVSERSAYEIVKGHRDAAERERELRDQYASYLAERGQRREQAAADAYQREYSDRMKAAPVVRPVRTTVGVGAGNVAYAEVGKEYRDVARVRAEEARRAAVEKFDSRDREQTFEEFLKRSSKWSSRRRSENDAE
jgi:hypothetical protein